MARDLPLVGISLADQVDANQTLYLRLKAKAQATLTTLASYFLINRVGYAIGARTYSFTTRIGRTYELGRIEAGEATLEVNNSDGLFDPSNSSSAFYPYLLPYRPLTIACAYPTTGNILNDTNLAPLTTNPASGSLNTYRMSVGKNDADFESGGISNWWAVGSGTVSATSAQAHSGTYSMLVGSSTYALLEVPVVPGKQMILSYWSTTAGGGITNTSLWVLDGGWLGGNSASLPTWTNNSNFRLITQTVTNPSVGWTKQTTAAFTPQTDKIALVIASGATSIYVDDVQVEFGSTATTFVTTGPTIYPLFDGFVERYPQTYQAPNRGQANLVATDAIASMSRNTLDNVYASKVIQSGALYYYPFSEASGSTSAYNNSLYQQSAMVPQQYGATAGTITFGDSSAQTSIVGAGTTGVGLKGVSATAWTALQNGNVNDIVFNADNPSYTFAFWTKLGDTAYSSSNTYFTAAASASAISSAYYPGGYLTVYGYTSGIFALWQIPDGSNTQASIFTPLVANVWYYVQATVTRAAGGTYTVTLSVYYSTGITTVTSAATATAWTGDIPMTAFNITPMSTATNTGFAHLVIARGTLNASDYATLGLAGLYGNSTGTRVAQIMQTYSAMNYLPIDAQYGKSFMPNALTSGSSVIDYLQTVTDSESGAWYVDADGFVVFKDRQDRLTKLIPSVTFGDGAGEIPYMGGSLVINYDPTYVYNNVTITRAGGTSVTVQDQDSLLSYMPRTYERTVQILADSETTDAAFFILSRYKDPHSRPETITIDASRNPSSFPYVLGLKVGDLIRVKKRPIGATMIQIDCFVERIEHSFDAKKGDWIVHLTVSPTIVYYWNMGAVSGTTTGAATAGSITITKAATSSAGISSLADVRPGQLLQWTISGTTTVEVVSGTPTETATTITLPVTRVGQFTASSNTIIKTTLAADMKMDSLAGVAVVASASLGASGTYLIDEEILTGTYAAGVLTPTARATSSTIQTAAGSSSTYTASHLSGATVYQLSAATAGNIAAGTAVTEYLPNQLTRYPYSVPDVYQWNGGGPNSYTSSSLLGSWTGSLVNGTLTTTTPASGIKYTAVSLNKLVDRDNYPSQDLAIGQKMSFYNNSAIESAAIVKLGPPSPTDASWTMTVYKITDSNATLAAAVTPDATTITTSAAVTASAILIGMEWMQVTAGSGTTTLTVTRGTPDAAVWTVLGKAPHYLYDKIYTVTNAGMANTYAAYNPVIEGYNVSTPTIGTARLGY